MEPLPPVKEVEYRCIIGRLFEELSGQEFITFAFETAKEFSSFRYEIAVRYRIQPGALEFKVLGMTATRTMMPAHGTARSVLKLPLLPVGLYTVKMIKSDGTENMFMIEVTKRGIQIAPPVPRKRFLDLVVDDSAAAPGSKILSTVSKTPPAPLIPRTIQKRQPPPPTPEELALLESLKSETPEERDAREELELFGGKKKVDKKDLEEVEKDIKSLDSAPTAKGAKTPIVEMKEVPANAKPEMKAEKPKAKPEPAKSEPTKSSTKPDTHKSEAHKDTHKSAKPVAKPDPKHAKPAAKDAKHKVETKQGKTKTAHTTVTKHAAKPAAKAAPKSTAKPSAKKPAVKSVPVKTGSAKTNKSAAPKKGAKKK